MYFAAGTTVGAAPTIPVMPTDANFDPPSTAECPEGHYYDGKESGVFGCKRCPYGAVTLKSGSVSADDCVVPPGYFASGTSAATGQLTKCPVTSATGEEEGYYRPAWKPVKEVISASGDGKDVCVKCGKGILSEAADRDEHPAAASGDKVAATSASCCE
jgi:Tyrosine-protein kinase ephrin type A/B receptor-like